MYHSDQYERCSAWFHWQYWIFNNIIYGYPLINRGHIKTCEIDPTETMSIAELCAKDDGDPTADFHPTTTRLMNDNVFGACFFCAQSKNSSPPAQEELYACSKHPEAGIKACSSCASSVSCENYCNLVFDRASDGTPSRWHRILHEESQSFLWFLQPQENDAENITFHLRYDQLLNRGGHVVKILWCKICIGFVSTHATAPLLAALTSCSLCRCTASPRLRVRGRSERLLSRRRFSRTSPVS